MSSQPDYAEVRKAQEFFGKAIDYIMNDQLKDLEKLVTQFLAENPQYSISDVFELFQSEGRTFLHICASSGHEHVFSYVLKYCKSVKKAINATDKNGFTPLINATISESDAIVSKLLSLNVDVNAQNKDGAAAIHFASADGNVSRLQLLIKNKADINLMSNTGNALHWASGKGRLDAMKLLIEKQVAIDAISPSGLPAVFMAAVSRCDEGVLMLVKAGADVGILITGNLTVLHICAENGLKKSVEAILDTAVGISCCSVKTSEGYYPIDLAAMSSERHIIELLLPHSPAASTKDIDALVEEGQIQLKQWHLAHEKKNESVNGSTESQGAIQSQHCTSSEEIMQLFTSLKKSPESEEIRNRAEELKSLGNEAYKIKDYEVAVKKYSESIELNPTNTLVWSNRSACYLALGQADKAMVDAEICRRLDPKWAKACYRLASARLALHQYEDAAVAAFEGCKLDESNKDLKHIMQVAVQKGREEHSRMVKEEEVKNMANNNKPVVIGHVTKNNK